MQRAVKTRLMVDRIGQCDGNGTGAKIERDPDRAKLGTVKRLDKNCDGAEEESFRKTQFDDSDQYKKEVHRHGIGDLRQVDRKARSQKCDQEITQELGNVVAGRSGGAGDEHKAAKHHDQADVDLADEGYPSPRLWMGSHEFFLRLLN